MTKRLALFAVALGAAASFAAPASASPGCSTTIQECIDRILSSIAVSDLPGPICVTPTLCVGGSTL
ncbi:MAG TPA: hypothetical protein VF519_13005 [Mycobacteriales bacterium]|jgi:hypothetical protein